MNQSGWVTAAEVYKGLPAGSLALRAAARPRTRGRGRDPEVLRPRPLWSGRSRGASAGPAADGGLHRLCLMLAHPTTRAADDFTTGPTPSRPKRIPGRPRLGPHSRNPAGSSCGHPAGMAQVSPRPCRPVVRRCFGHTEFQPRHEAASSFPGDGRRVTGFARRVVARKTLTHLNPCPGRLTPFATLSPWEAAPQACLARGNRAAFRRHPSGLDRVAGTGPQWLRPPPQTLRVCRLPTALPTTSRDMDPLRRPRGTPGRASRLAGDRRHVLRDSKLALPDANPP